VENKSLSAFHPIISPAGHRLPDTIIFAPESS